MGLVLTRCIDFLGRLIHISGDLIILTASSSAAEQMRERGSTLCYVFS